MSSGLSPSQEFVKGQWVKFLGDFLLDYRSRSGDYPLEVVLEVLMEYFFETGTIKKNSEGRYLLPFIVEDLPLQKELDQERGSNA